MDTKHAPPPQDAGILGGAGGPAPPPSYGATTAASHPATYTDNNTYQHHTDTMMAPRSGAYGANSNTGMENTASDLLLLLMAILLPPVAVFLKTGCGGQFLINVLLCILGWLPGVIHAFYVVLRYPGDSGRVRSSGRRGI